MSLTFHVRCADTQLGESVFVVGNHHSFGAWDLGHALQLTTNNEHFPKWRLSPPAKSLPPMPAGQTFQYKYVIMRPGDQSFARWESFEGNRTLQLSLPPNDVVEVCDGEFGDADNCASRLMRQPTDLPPMSVSVWVVRHAERMAFADWGRWEAMFQKEGRSRFDDPLTERGHEMADLTAKRLWGDNIHAVYSSPFTRCVETAAAISAAANQPLCIEDGLIEFLHPEWYGGKPPQLPRLDWCKAVNRSYAPVLAVGALFPEDAASLRCRCRAIVSELASQHLVDAASKAAVALVCHGHMIEHGVLPGVVPGQKDDARDCQYAAVSRLRFDFGGWGWRLEVDRAVDHVRHLLDASKAARYV